MITRITDINKYSSLFKRAWDDLKARNVFTQEELEYYEGLGDTFTCLEDYFTRIHTLIDVEDPNYEYIMLPIDEARFEINADTREILIPAGFKKLVGVQGDHIAETLIFSIDRFFDFVDLLNTSIYIQWVDENNNDRATPINMIHYDAASGKILFGWPLSAEVTKKARNINFSVRFFIKEEGINGKIQYSFNTKIHQITIAPALQPDLNADIRIEDVENYFTNAIKDSPSTSAPPAAVPVFSAPGLDLPTSADIGTTAYELKVQAVADDAGYINYMHWYHVTEDGTDDEILTGVEKFEPVTTPVNDGKTVYYISPSEGVYTKYTGEITADTTGLYERYYTYTIPAATGNDDADITGGYKVSVVNRTGGNVSKTVSSTMCYLYGPGTEENVVYSKDLAPAALMGASGSTLLTELSTPGGNKTNIAYSWKFSAQSADTLTSNAELGTAASITTSTPGWYQVNAIAIRNRKSIAVDSTICKVTNYPVAPTITIPAEDTTVDLTALETRDLIVSIEDYPTPTALYSDELIYEWKGQAADDGENYVTITPDNIAKYRVSATSALNTNTLTVYGADSSSVSNAVSYVCVITNKLNNTTKVSAAADAAEAAIQSPAFVIK